MQLPHVMALGREMQRNCVSDLALLSVYYTHSMPLISLKSNTWRLLTS